MDARRTIGPAALGVDQADVVEQCAVGRGAAALGSITPGVVAAGRQAQDRAHHPNRPDAAMLIDEPELHREAAPKMSAAFFKMSRSMRSRSFSRRNRVFSATRSDGDGAAAC